jgi:chromosome segregation ATPase
MKHLQDKTFEIVELKMKRSLEDLYTIKNLLQSNSKHENKQIQKLQLQCSNYKTEINELERNLKEKNGQLQITEEHLKQQNESYASLILQLDNLKQEKALIQDTVHQITGKFKEESDKKIQLEITLNLKEQELEKSKQDALMKDQEIELFKQDTKRMEEVITERDTTLKEHLIENLSEIESLEYIIDSLQKEYKTLNNQLTNHNICNIYSLTRTKSRIPVRSSSLSSLTQSSSDITDHTSLKTKRDLQLFQERIVEIVIQNKHLIKTMETSKTNMEMFKRKLNEMYKVSEERYKKMLISKKLNLLKQ